MHEKVRKKIIIEGSNMDEDSAKRWAGIMAVFGRDIGYHSGCKWICTNGGEDLIKEHLKKELKKSAKKPVQKELPGTPKTEAEVIKELRGEIRSLKSKLKDVTNDYETAAHNSRVFEQQSDGQAARLASANNMIAAYRTKIKELDAHHKQDLKKLNAEIKKLKATGVFPSNYKPVGGYTFKSLDRLSTVDLNEYEELPTPNFRDLIKSDETDQPDKILSSIDIKKLTKTKKTTAKKKSKNPTSRETTMSAMYQKALQKYNRNSSTQYFEHRRM
jgi:hypothetical protein